MKKIDYSKWYGSHVCPFCVTKHEKMIFELKKLGFLGISDISVNDMAHIR